MDGRREEGLDYSTPSGRIRISTPPLRSRSPRQLPGCRAPQLAAVVVVVVVVFGGGPRPFPPRARARKHLRLRRCAAAAGAAAPASAAPAGAAEAGAAEAGAADSRPAGLHAVACRTAEAHGHQGEEQGSPRAAHGPVDCRGLFNES
ncbi:unnamed protein product [Prorocentrum cordatum]|uniref:Uncharacterized protein n=1 Tax=Prorocentrum cordatum TaxID=2364126 RepID=A0ABN9TEJ2_9DINO|nr:unnamed protein product [Polarella glacialis]